MTDFEQLCEGIQEDHQEDYQEDHQEEDLKEEAEVQDQSLPLLPKALYWQLPPET